MNANKIVTKIDGVENKTIDFNDLKSGLAPGAHTVTVEAYNGSTLISTQTKNITITVTSYDVDYQAVLDAATTNGDPLPDAAQQDIDNQLMIDYKATGVYNKRDVIFKSKGTATPAFKLYCWKRKIKMIAYGGLIWDSQGVKPNGTNGYIDPLYDTTNSTNYLLNDVGIDWVQVEPFVSGFKVITGGYEGISTTITGIYPKTSDTQSIASIHGGNVLVPLYAIVGYNSVNRISSITTKANDTGTYSHTSGAKWSNPLFIFVRNKISSKESYYDTKVSFVSIGASVYNEYATLKTILG